MVDTFCSENSLNVRQNLVYVEKKLLYALDHRDDNSQSNRLLVFPVAFFLVFFFGTYRVRYHVGSTSIQAQFAIYLSDSHITASLFLLQKIL